MLVVTISDNAERKGPQQARPTTRTHFHAMPPLSLSTFHTTTTMHEIEHISPIEYPPPPSPRPFHLSTTTFICCGEGTKLPSTAEQAPPDNFFTAAGGTWTEAFVLQYTHGRSGSDSYINHSIHSCNGGGGYSRRFNRSSKGDNRSYRPAPSDR